MPVRLLVRQLCLLMALTMSVSLWAETKPFACGKALESTSGLSFTQQTAAFLKALLERGAVSTESLTTLKVAIEKQQARLPNPIDSKTSIEGGTHFSAVDKALGHADLDRHFLLETINELLKEKQIIQQDKISIQKETKLAAIKMTFHKINSGQFTRSHNNKNEIIKIERPFLVSHTRITKNMWNEIMPEEVQFKIENTTQLDELVSVSWWMAVKFANEMSRRHGLKPVYNLDKIKFDDEYYVELHHQLPTEKLTEPPDRQEGYRLPTWQEYAFLLTNLGQVQSDQFFPGITREKLEQIMRDRRTHKEDEHPFMIDGHLFYNIYEMTAEWHHNAIKDKTWDRAAGAFPIIAPSSGLFSKDEMANRYYHFRLVRTINP